MISAGSPLPDGGRPAGRVGSLDGLRAVATVVVFVFHLTWRAPLLKDRVAPVTGHLDTGVEIFFILSGFLIFGPFAAAIADRTRRPALVPYALRRAARIWPAYLVALAAVTVFGTAHLTGGLGVLKHATLTYNYFDDRGGRGLSVAWTLVVELTFYAAVPLIAWAISRTGRALLAWSTSLVLLGVWTQYLVANSQTVPLWVRVLPPAMLTLGLGMVFASVRALGDRAGRLGRALRGLAARPAIPLGIAAGAFVLLVVVVQAGTDLWHRPDERYLKELLQAVIAGGLVLPVVLAPEQPGRFVRALGRPVISYLGTISFGTYLWHIPVLIAMKPLVSSRDLPVAATGWFLALAITLALADLSWQLIERPVIEGVARRLKQRQAASVR